jgi:hypothetical protein
VGPQVGERRGELLALTVTLDFSIEESIGCDQRGNQGIYAAATFIVGVIGILQDGRGTGDPPGSLVIKVKTLPNWNRVEQLFGTLAHADCGRLESAATTIEEGAILFTDHKVLS